MSVDGGRNGLNINAASPIISSQRAPAAEPPLKDHRRSEGLVKDEQRAFLDLPLHTSFRPSSDGDESIYSVDNDNERQRGRLLAPSTLRFQSSSPLPPRTWRSRCKLLWASNKGLILVFVSQFFGALMNVIIRVLETSEDALNTFQVMFARMAITLLLGSLYMWWAAVDHFPLGPKEVRMLLIARGFGGFFGLLGIYYSLQYLPLAEATVITFLAPIVACWACSFLINEPFTFTEQMAGLVSLLGVVLIARPTSFFHHESSVPPVLSVGTGDGTLVANATITRPISTSDNVTSAQRLFAIFVALIGVAGAATAYTTIRWIGTRTHPLISINYFAAWSTLVSLVILLFVPGMDFKLPSGFKQWFYLIFLGICGFVMQFLMTAGLTYEKSSRATNMVYTNMLFALAFDKIVFDTTPGALSILGSSLILGSALYVALQKDLAKRSRKSERAGADEENGSNFNCRDHENTGDSRCAVQEVQLRSMR